VNFSKRFSFWRKPNPDHDEVFTKALASAFETMIRNYFSGDFKYDPVEIGILLGVSSGFLQNLKRKGYDAEPFIDESLRPLARFKKDEFASTVQAKKAILELMILQTTDEEVVQ